MRLGIDLGGTKIEMVALDPDGSILLRERVATPSGYDAVLHAIRGLVIRQKQNSARAARWAWRSPAR